MGEYIHGINFWNETAVLQCTQKNFYSYCQTAFSKGFVTHTHNMYQSLHISTKVLNLKE